MPSRSTPTTPARPRPRTQRRRSSSNRRVIFWCGNVDRELGQVDRGDQLKEAFQTIYRKPGDIKEIAAGMLIDGRFTTPENRSFLKFFGGGKRGFARQRQDERAVQRVTEEREVTLERSASAG
jgi:hypothetical protein